MTRAVLAPSRVSHPVVRSFCVDSVTGAMALTDMQPVALVMDLRLRGAMMTSLHQVRIRAPAGKQVEL